MDVKDFCGGVANVLSLPIRSDRREKLQERFSTLGSGWELKIHEAVDGSVTPHPDYWISGDGAWGCYRSHLRIIEDALNNGSNGVLIFEDDAVFSDEKTLGESWVSYLQGCLNELPEDWGMFYLGGQHQRQKEQPVVQYSPHLHYAYSINRTHGYAISKAALPIVYKHLLSRSWQPRHHIDHHLEALHRSNEFSVFSASTWLVSQDEGPSNISGKTDPLRTWEVNAKQVEAIEVSSSTKIRYYTVGYGSVGTGGSLGYEDKKVSVSESKDNWNWISTHAPSRVTIEVTKKTKIIGAVNDTGKPHSPVFFKVDGHSLGTLTNAGEVTESLTLTKGIHVLEINTKDNRQCHTVWGIL